MIDTCELISNNDLIFDCLQKIHKLYWLKAQPTKQEVENLFCDFNWSLPQVWDQIHDILVEREVILIFEGYFVDERKEFRRFAREVLEEINETASKYKLLLKNVDTVGSVSADLSLTTGQYLATICCNQNLEWSCFFGKNQTVRLKIDNLSQGIEMIFLRRNLNLSNYLSA